MRNRILTILLIFTTLTACSLVSLTDQQIEVDEEVLPSAPISTHASTGIMDAKSNLATPTSTRDIATEEVACVRVVPGSPYLDQTIPDGTILFPGQNFTKTWRLSNSGSCAWDGDFAVIWFSGSDLGVVHHQSLNDSISPGQSIDISVDMQAPLIPGLYQSNWKLMAPGGQLYGIGPQGESPFWAMIEVVEVSTPTYQQTLTSTPPPVVLIEGEFQLFLGDVVNLDTGAVRPPGEDLMFDKDILAHLSFIPLNGARLAQYGFETPSFTDCISIPLEKVSISVTSASSGMYYCYRSSQGLPGWLNITLVDPEQNRVIVNFVTWSVP
jgi:hypothetical protein